MKICYLCDEYPPEVHGGIGVFVNNITTALASKGHQPVVIGFYNQEENHKIIEENGVIIIKLKKVKNFLNNFIIDRITKFWKLKKILYRIKPDLIEVQDWQGPIAFWPRMNIPILTRFHGSTTFFQTELQKKTSPILFFLEKKSISRSNYYCAVSNYVMENTKDIFDLKKIQIPVIYNFIDIPKIKFNLKEKIAR
jgi:glycosyltransferase involved in cell wall biosynthesis